MRVPSSRSSNGPPSRCSAPRVASRASFRLVSPAPRISVRWCRGWSVRSAKTFPRVLVRLEEGGTGELIGQAQNGHVDVAFVRDVAAPIEGLAIHHLFDEAMVAVLPSRHDARSATGRSEPPIPLKALVGRDVRVLPPPGGTGADRRHHLPHARRPASFPGSGRRHCGRRRRSTSSPPDTAFPSCRPRCSGCTSTACRTDGLDRRAPTEGAAQSGVAPRRSIAGASAIPEHGQAGSEKRGSQRLVSPGMAVARLPINQAAPAGIRIPRALYAAQGLARGLQFSSGNPHRARTFKARRVGECSRCAWRSMR